MYKRILIPLDESSLSHAILPHVQAVAQGLDSEMILLHVIPNPVPQFAPSTHPLAWDITKDERKDIERHLKNLCAEMEKKGARVTYLMRDGPVAETILEVADIMQADMIAMSTHGRSGAQLILLGSVTYQVVRHSPLPVLVIRAK